MPIKFTMDSIDSLDEAIKVLYRKTEKGYILDVEGGKSDEEIKGLSSALEKEREARKELESKISKYGGKTPDEVNAILDELEAAKAGGKFDIKNLPDSEKEAMFKDLLDARTKKYERQLQELADSLEVEKKRAFELENNLTTRDLETTIMGYLPGKVVDSAIEDAVAIAKMNLKRDPNDGKFYAEDGTDAEKWLASQIEKRTHWQKPSHGSGAKGGIGTTKDSKESTWAGAIPNEFKR